MTGLWSRCPIRLRKRKSANIILWYRKYKPKIEYSQKCRIKSTNYRPTTETYSKSMTPFYPLPNSIIKQIHFLALKNPFPIPIPTNIIQNSPNPNHPNISPLDPAIQTHLQPSRTPDLPSRESFHKSKYLPLSRQVVRLNFIIHGIKQ